VTTAASNFDAISASTKGPFRARSTSRAQRARPRRICSAAGFRPVVPDPGGAPPPRPTGTAIAKRCSRAVVTSRCLFKTRDNSRRRDLEAENSQRTPACNPCRLRRGGCGGGASPAAWRVFSNAPFVQLQRPVRDHRRARDSCLKPGAARGRANAGRAIQIITHRKEADGMAAAWLSHLRRGGGAHRGT